jgi:hypothetical protein
MSINRFRRLLYKTAKMLGDVQAASSGSPKKISKRIGRRIVGKATGRGIGKLFK